jgi:hypothetical protein
MKPSRHVIISAVLGAGIWFYTKSIYATIICFISGILVDLDHIVEYAIHFGLKDFSFKNLYEKSRETDRHKGERGYERLYLIFHSSEVAIFLWVAAICIENIFLLAFALGYSSHIVLDSFGNTIHPISYFILHRSKHKFNTRKYFKK